jgi:hypothetical protein
MRSSRDHAEIFCLDARPGFSYGYLPAFKKNRAYHSKALAKRPRSEAGVNLFFGDSEPIENFIIESYFSNVIFSQADRKGSRDEKIDVLEIHCDRYPAFNNNSPGWRWQD